MASNVRANIGIFMHTVTIRLRRRFRVNMFCRCAYSNTVAELGFVLCVRECVCLSANNWHRTNTHVREHTLTGVSYNNIPMDRGKTVVKRSVVAQSHSEATHTNARALVGLTTPPPRMCQLLELRSFLAVG